MLALLLAVPALLLCALALRPKPVQADPPTQSALHEPKPGSKERKAILDALHPLVAKKLRRKVIFQVSQLKVSGGWAFAVVTALKADGS